MTTELPDAPRRSRSSSEDGIGPEESLADEAVLSGLGLLDAGDRSAFERALDAADPATRAALREIEAAWAGTPMLRSRELPDPSLRRRVIEAIRAHVHGAEVASGGSIEADARIEDLRGPLQGLVEQIREQQETTRRTRTAPWLWRAASLVLGAGLLVSAWFQVRLSERVAEIAELSIQRQTDEQLRALIGPGFDRFLAGRTRVVGFASVEAGGDGAATLYLDPAVGDGFLLAFGLGTRNGPYELRSVDGDASAMLLSFDPHDAVAGFRISADRLASLAGGRFEIVDVSGDVILRSA